MPACANYICIRKLRGEVERARMLLLRLRTGAGCRGALFDAFATPIRRQRRRPPCAEAYAQEMPGGCLSSAVCAQCHSIGACFYHGKGIRCCRSVCAQQARTENGQAVDVHGSGAGSAQHAAVHTGRRRRCPRATPSPPARVPWQGEKQVCAWWQRGVRLTEVTHRELLSSRARTVKVLVERLPSEAGRQQPDAALLRSQSSLYRYPMPPAQFHSASAAPAYACR